MSLLVFVPFTGFTPDGSQFGEGMKLVENALPLHGGHRPLPQAPSVASATDDPVTGAFVHIFQAERTEQVISATRDVNTDSGVVRSTDGSGVSLYEAIDEDDPDDSDYVILPGAPSNLVYGAGVATAADPGVDTGHSIRYRYRVQGGAGAWQLDVDFDDGLFGVPTFQIDSVSGTGDTEWVERDVAIDPGDLAAGPEYSSIAIDFDATAAGSEQFGRPSADTTLDGWTNQAGSSTNVYQSIDESVASDSDYAASPPLALGGARRTYRVALGVLDNPWVKVAAFGDYTIRYRYRATNAGTDLVARLGHGSGAGTVIASQTHAAVTAGSWIAGSLEVNDEMWPLASSVYGELWLEFEAHWPSAATSVATQVAVATADVASSGVTPSGEATIWEAVAVDDADIAVFDGAAGSYFNVSAPAVDPGVDTEHLIRVKGFSSTAPSSAAGTAELYQGSTLIFSGNFTVTGVGSEVTLSMHSSFAALITSYPDLRLRVEDRKVGGALRISYAAFETPEPRRLRVSWAEFETPPTARIEVSWLKFFVPEVVTDYEGDKPEIYAGTRTKLYKADAGGFEDLSKGGGYASGTDEPGGWHFAPWGADVLATNYVDPLQVSSPSGAQYADAITAPSPAPKARFVTVWRERVVLGDINLTGHAADEIWISAPDDYADFEPAASTRAGFQPVRSTPGQVMGLLGGQTGVIAKRNSLFALLYSGTPLYRIEDISRTVGVGYPRSLVGDAAHFYFHSGGHFYQASVAQAPETIGSSVLSQYVLDNLKPGPYTAMAEEDQVMVGARDSATGLILWSLQGPSDTAWRHSKALVYNPRTGEWAVLNRPVDVSFIATNPNSVAQSFSLLRGVLGFTYDGTDIAWFRWSGATAYGATFTTKVRELPADPEVSRDPETGRFQSAASRQKRVVREVIPIVSVPDGSSLPELTVTVTGYRQMDLQGQNAEDTVTVANRNERGVYHLGKGVPGFFHRFSVALPEGYAGLARCEGLYVVYDLEGAV